MELVKFVKNFCRKIQKSRDKNISAAETGYSGVDRNKLAYVFSTGNLLRFIKLGVSYKGELTSQGGLP
jgi:hypothetical protein